MAAAVASLKSAAIESMTTSLILLRAPVPPFGATAAAAPAAAPLPLPPPAPPAPVAVAIMKGSILSSASMRSIGVARPFSTKTLSVEGAAYEGEAAAEAAAAAEDGREGRRLLLSPFASWASLRTGGSPFSEQSHRAEPSSPPSSSGSCAVRSRRRQSWVLPAVASPFFFFFFFFEKRVGVERLSFRRFVRLLHLSLLLRPSLETYRRLPSGIRRGSRLRPARPGAGSRGRGAAWSPGSGGRGGGRGRHAPSASFFCRKLLSRFSLVLKRTKRCSSR